MPHQIVTSNATLHWRCPYASRVKCFSDSGFFIRAKDLPGVAYRENFYAQVTELHEIARFLPESCTSRMAPENVVGDVQTPLFLLNSDFDLYQLSNNVIPYPPDDQGWSSCVRNFDSLQNCTTPQLNLIYDFRASFLKTLEGVDENWSRGTFISSCFIHDFVFYRHIWQGTPNLQNMTIQQALGEWYFDRSHVELIDTQHLYPLNCPLNP